MRAIVDLDASELSAAIRDREVSCVEVMTSYLDHIDRVNPAVNALVLLRPRAELLAEAAEKDRRLGAGDEVGWMHGFPHAVKDLADVAGLPTTQGFFRPPFDAPVPSEDSLHVARIRAAGAIFIGKTNTPEFGLGSNTYNNVHGTTGNAYDPRRTAGGSSGGAAVGVALRMLPVADGSDFMGSLRNPPGWNNVFGLRPSFGRVPSESEDVFLAQGGVEGPIARTATDLALLLQTMAGYDDRAPLSIESSLGGLSEADVRGRRVAWLGDLGGYLPMEPDVLRVTSEALQHFAALGMDVTALDGLPTSAAFRGVEELWPTWLAYRHFQSGGSLIALDDVPELGAAVKPEVRFEIEGFRSLTVRELRRAAVARTGLYLAFRTLFETCDYAVLPTAQVMPFDASTPWPAQIEGVPMSSYHRWMEVTTIGTLLGAPTLAMPAGFAGGLPIGLQVIGRNHADRALLELARAWEQQTRFVQDRPPPMLATLP